MSGASVAQERTRSCTSGRATGEDVYLERVGGGAIDPAAPADHLYHLVVAGGRAQHLGQVVLMRDGAQAAAGAVAHAHAPCHFEIAAGWAVSEERRAGRVERTVARQRPADHDQ